MKKILLALIAALFGLGINAQTDKAISIIKEANKQHSNITCQFEQEHHITAINKVEQLKGMLYYTYNNMAMHYSVPATDVFIINGDQLYMVAKKRKNLFNLKSNSTMRQLANLLLNSMAGDVNTIAKETGAIIKYEKEGSHYIFTLTKEKKSVKGYKEVVLKYDTKTLLLDWMKLEEFNGNFNTYELTNQEFKTINSEIFKINN